MPKRATGTQTRVPSSCNEVVDGRLTRIRPGQGEADALAALVHGQFRGLTLNESFPCLGGTAAMRKEQYRIGVYAPLASPAAVRDCAMDLKQIVQDFPKETNPVAVLVAVFDGPVLSDEESFEKALWTQLQSMHRIDDSQPNGTASTPVVVDERDEGFVFSGRPFFVVGLHAAASRWARRFAWPTLVFNSLTHDEFLRKKGQYERMQAKIRARDVRLQGDMNPAVDLPQLAQFAGRMVEPDWQCPI